MYDCYSDFAFLLDSNTTVEPATKINVVPATDDTSSLENGNFLTLENAQVEFSKQPLAGTPFPEDLEPQLPEDFEPQRGREKLVTYLVGLPASFPLPTNDPPAAQLNDFPFSKSTSNNDETSCSILGDDFDDAARAKEEETKRRKREAVRKCRSNKKQKTEEMEEKYEKCKAENERLIDENRQLKIDAARLAKERWFLDQTLKQAGESIAKKGKEIETLKFEIEHLKNDCLKPAAASADDTNANDTVEALMREVERLKDQLKSAQQAFDNETEKLKRMLTREQEWNSCLNMMLRDYQTDSFV